MNNIQTVAVVTRETEIPTLFIKENPIRIKDMSYGYIKNTLDKIKKDIRYQHFIPALQAEIKYKILRNAKIY